MIDLHYLTYKFYKSYNLLVVDLEYELNIISNSSDEESSEEESSEE